MHFISKSQFMARALEFFREVERTGTPLIITERGSPILKLIPYREDPRDTLRMPRDSVVGYKAPLRPVGEQEWEANR